MSTIIAPSVLAANPDRIEEAVALASSCGCAYLHIDIMDGRFVPAKTFDPDFVKRIRLCAPKDLTLDVHLMVENPWVVIPAYAESGADSITFHLETCPSDQEAHATLSLIHALGKKAGISIKPNTPIEALDPFLNEADLILVMSVEPGKGGQSFLPDSLARIAALKEKRKQSNATFLLEVDGGINEITGPKCVRSGADILVAGSYLYGHERFKERVEALFL